MTKGKDSARNGLFFLGALWLAIKNRSLRSNPHHGARIIDNQATRSAGEIMALVRDFKSTIGIRLLKESISVACQLRPALCSDDMM